MRVCGYECVGGGIGVCVYYYLYLYGCMFLCEVLFVHTCSKKWSFKYADFKVLTFNMTYCNNRLM